jgi:hypothetical protein
MIKRVPHSRLLLRSPQSNALRLAAGEFGNYFARGFYRKMPAFLEVAWLGLVDTTFRRALFHALSVMLKKRGRPQQQQPSARAVMELNA